MSLTFTPEMKKVLDRLSIDHGSNEPSEKEFCIMEAVAYIADEPHSDEPVCVSDTIAEWMIAINDTRRKYDEANQQRERNKLKKVAPDIMGTRPTKKERGEYTDRDGNLVVGTITRPNLTKGYQAAEVRRLKRLKKELIARGYEIANDGDPEYLGYLDFSEIKTEDAIDIARILAGIKNKV